MTPEAAAAAEAEEVRDLNSKLFAQHAASKQLFLLNQKATDLFTALIVTEIIVVIKDRILAKNNQKKEKAERNKANAEKFKKRPKNTRFGNRRSNSES